MPTMLTNHSQGGTAIVRIEPLPTNGPYPTADPFLFCVYHYDMYPRDLSGGKMECLERGNGRDFHSAQPYRMYHGAYVPGFPQHPHRGFETITTTITGIIDHADSLGNAGRYGHGDVQWMTAGKGIVHGEMFPLLHGDNQGESDITTSNTSNTTSSSSGTTSPKNNTLRFFQLWLNLPSKHKMVEPSFKMFWANEVPVWTSENKRASVTVWAGNYFVNEDTSKTKTTTTATQAEEGDGVHERTTTTPINTRQKNSPPPYSWASDPKNDVAVMRIVIQGPGGKVVIPKAHQASATVRINRTLYLVEGGGRGSGLQIDGRTLQQEKLCITLDATKDATIEVPADTYTTTTTCTNSTTEGTITAVELLLLQGRPINEPVVQHGPFVMNTQHEIQQAVRDYRATQFGGWPWERDDMIFPQPKGRFALLEGTEYYPPAAAAAAAVLPSNMNTEEAANPTNTTCGT